MRILHMIPDIGISNGMMSVILNYAKAMPRDVIFDVVYFSEKEKTKKAKIEALGGRVYKIDSPSPKDLLNRKLDGFFAEHKNEWQALHIHCPHFAIFIAPNAKRAGIKKIFVHCHSTVYSDFGNGARNKILSLYAKYFIKNKFACGVEAGNLWYGNKKFEVLNNAIDLGKYEYNEKIRSSVREELNVKDSLVVGHIGKTDIPRKNHVFLFKVFAEIKKEKANSKLVLMGGEMTEELISLSKELEIADDVVYLGLRGDIPELLQACDVFVFPSTSEGLPLSVIEAQAAGLPVVMSDTITDEVKVLSSTISLSIDESPENWAKKAVEISRLPRCNTFGEMCDKGWNINECADRLLNYYEE